MTEVTVTSSELSLPSLPIEDPNSVIGEFADELYEKLKKSGKFTDSSPTAKQDIYKVVQAYASQMKEEGLEDEQIFSTENTQNMMKAVDDKINSNSRVGAGIVTEAIVTGGFGKEVLEAFLERLAANAASRDDIQNELADITNMLKFFSIVQSIIQGKISKDQGFRLDGLYFVPADFGVTTDAEMRSLPIYKELVKLTGHSGTGRINLAQFLDTQGIEYAEEYSDKVTGEDEFDRQVAALATSITDKSKVLNDDANITMTKLNRASSNFNATQEAMSHFLNKLAEVMQSIIRAFS